MSPDRLDGQGGESVVSGERRGRLLVVDFDFFFHNPHEGLPAPHRGDEGLYDWAHGENQLLREIIWPIRAEEFLRAGIEPPRCEGYENFWERFTFTSDNPPLFYADSNLYAGRLSPRHYALFDLEIMAWQDVHLFDAHHDSGYPHQYGPTSFEEWAELGEFSCEDWMLVHHAQGSRLALTYPAWRPDGDSHPPLIPLDTTVDDGGEAALPFDAVFLCRSGSWVPSWCDDQFTELLAAFPGRAHLFPGSAWAHPRPDPLPQARHMADIFTELRNRLEAQAVPRTLPSAPTPRPTSAEARPHEHLPGSEQARFHPRR
ncbi:hypothetical protein [Streptomyces rubiginosohelvolus]|uniref:hypothetical protein n=1 Tax=Streptomyces rubiginosohelvolus TaxID=67362 RepID=UPI00371AE515